MTFFCFNLNFFILVRLNRFSNFIRCDFFNQLSVQTLYPSTYLGLYIFLLYILFLILEPLLFSHFIACLIVFRECFYRFREDLYCGIFPIDTRVGRIMKSPCFHHLTSTILNTLSLLFYLFIRFFSDTHMQTFLKFFPGVLEVNPRHSLISTQRTL